MPSDEDKEVNVAPSNTLKPNRAGSPKTNQVSDMKALEIDDEKTINMDQMSCQQKVEHAMNTVFAEYGGFVARHPCKVFWTAFIILIAFSAGMAKFTTYEDESLIWTPSGNPSILAQKRSQEMFTSNGGGIISFMAEAKTNQAAGVLTSAAVQEFTTLKDQFLAHSFTVKDEEGEDMDITFADVCNQVMGQCMSFGSLLDFDTTDLLTQVQSGQANDGEVYMLNPILGGIKPDDFSQDQETGANNIDSAIAATLSFPYELETDGGIKMDMMELWEISLNDLCIEFNEGSTYIDVFVFSGGGIQESFATDLTSDLSGVQIAVMLVAVYCIIFMGTCSPIHFRSAAAGIALLCVGLSFASSNGFAFLVGGKSAGIHNLLPFLLIGIGVDDCFVISSCIDQTNPNDPVEKRMYEGIKKAGSSITITSLTNAIVFFLGLLCSLEALSSFCMFAGLGVLALYFSSMTLFTAFMVWDITRQVNRKGDCCGACCCSEDTIICCRGYFLTQKQKSYPYIEEQDVPDERATDEQQFSSGTQKFLYETYSAYLLSPVGKIIALSVWLIFSAISAWGCSMLKIDFKATYFISQNSFVSNYLNKNDEYFQTGEIVDIYTDNPSMDIASLETQQRLQTFNAMMKACDGCAQPWTTEESFRSWYESLLDYAESGIGGCAGAYDATEGVITAANWQACFDDWISGAGARFASDLLIEDGVLTGFKQQITLIYVEDAATDGVQVLADMGRLCDDYGIDSCFSYSQKFFDYESYVVFGDEALKSVLIALAGVFIIMIIVTANLRITLFVLLCVALVDLFLLSLLYLWDLTFNSVSVTNITIAIGLAVDYSAHIAHGYMHSDTPQVHPETGKECTDGEKRTLKARTALGSMGSSVFHGAFSTFLAIVVLSPSQSYIFRIFFRMWFGIIVFGVANGFILLPVLLSLCGPLPEDPEKKQDEKDVAV